MRSPRRTLTAAVTAGVAVLSLLGPSPAGAAPAVPGLTWPAEGAMVSANPTLEWQASSGAVKYRVQVATTPTFSPTVFSAVTFNTKATPLTDLAQMTHYWRVQAIDAANAESPYGEVRTFVKELASAPTPIAPGEGQVVGFPEEPAQFSWTPAAGAKTYDIEIDDDSGFTSPLVSASTANASYTLTEPQTVGQPFWWRVRGKSADGLPTQFSSPRSFSFSWPGGVPVPSSPSDTASPAIEEVVLDWEPVLGAQSYEVEVSPNQDFTGTLAVDVTVVSTRYSPPTNLVNGSYFWRVRALNAASPQGAGPWSPIRTFTKDWPAPDAPPFPRVTLLTPADGDFRVTEPYFSWTPVRLASHYELQLSTDPNFSPGNVSSCSTNHTTIEACGDPAPGVFYHWRVRPVDDGKPVLGLFSEPFTFMYFPSLVVRTGPEDGTATSVPVLTWERPEEDIAKFKVTVKKANGTVAVTADVANLAYTPTGLKPTEGPFLWTVQTIDAQGRVGPEPDWSWFILVPPDVTSATPTPTSTTGVFGLYAPTLSWEPVAVAEPSASDDDLADSYEIWIAREGTGVFTRLTATPTAGATAYSHTGDLAPGTWEWYVKAYDGTTLVSVGATSTFTVLNYPATELVAPTHCPPATACTALLDTPTFDWEPVPAAGWYIVYLATDPNFTNITKTYETQYTRLTPRESLVDSQAGQATYWYARPCLAKNVRCGPEPATFVDDDPSPVRAFRKQSHPVQLVSPAGGAEVANEIRFAWTDFLVTNQGGATPVTQEARTYRIQVSAAADFSTLLDDKTVDQTTYTAFDRTYPEGSIYWRVQAIDGSSNPLTWSEVRSLTKRSPAPTLVAPAAGATVSGVPQFRWASQAYAARYEIEVYKNVSEPLNVSNRVLTGTTKQTAWTPLTALPAGTYGWRVRRLDANVRTGPWTAATNLELRLFTTGGAAATLIGPADGVTLNDDTLLLTWHPVGGAARYRVETSTASSFGSLRENVTTVTAAYAPTSDYLDGTYFWRVVTLDGSGNALATSEARRFVKATQPPTTQPTQPPTTQPPTTQGSTGQPGSGRSGYWMISADGTVYSFGDARDHGSQAVAASDIEPTPSGNGYWILSAKGEVFPKGDARSYGRATMSGTERATSLSATPSGDGYWIFTDTGRVIAFGSASFKGDMSKVALNGPVLDSVATPSGQGYYMVASDGGLFTFGDARFSGSMGGTRLNRPVVSMAPDPDGDGYWLVAADGGIFAFGAPFYGSTGHLSLNKPVTGMVTGRSGYLMVAEDGGIFAFGDARFHGSLGDNPPSSPVSAVALLR